jgi:hypothetical protein
MGVTVKVTTTETATVVALSGWPGNGEVLPAVADGIVALAEDRETLVVDLSGIVLTHPGALRAFIDGVCQAPVDVRLVCGRLSGRRLIRSCGPSSHFGTFSTVEDALADTRQATPATAAPSRAS